MGEGEGAELGTGEGRRASGWARVPGTGAEDAHGLLHAATLPRCCASGTAPAPRSHPDPARVLRRSSLLGWRGREVDRARAARGTWHELAGEEGAGGWPSGRGAGGAEWGT